MLKNKTNFKPKTPIPYSHESFVIAWQTLGDRSAVADLFGLPKTKVSQRANYLRSAGVRLKKMRDTGPRGPRGHRFSVAHLNSLITAQEAIRRR